MRKPTESYLAVNYELRPRKQIERRMLVDTLQKLAEAGFEISKYQYTGMGSLYYVDFILFHKLLGIQKMLNVEFDNKIEKRLEFNKPFDCVDTVIDSIGSIIPSLSKDCKHFVWMDYDDVIAKDVMDDCINAARHLIPGSLILVTVDVEPPTESKSTADWKDYFEREAERFIPASLDVRDFNRKNLPRLNAAILRNAISEGVSTQGARFFQLFNFVYADTHKMLSFGGVIGAENEHEMIDKSGVKDLFYVRTELFQGPYEINVPLVTRKERLYLDAAMPCKKGWKPEDFEFAEEDVRTWREIYRFVPSYAELLF